MFGGLDYLPSTGTKIMTIRPLLLALAMAGTTAVSAHATAFDYVYTTTLELESGSDSAGLSGATVSIVSEFNTDQTYYDPGSGARVDSLGATVTISGASVSENNGTFTLPASAFFPEDAGLLNPGNGGNLVITLPSSELFYM